MSASSTIPRVALIAALPLLMGGRCGNPVEVGVDAGAQWELVWSDEFDGGVGELPDPAFWSFDVGGHGWGNAQLEYDTNRPENASHDGAGNLVITARKESYQGSAYTSARIKTLGRMQQKYGRIEARMKLPVGQGIWPAFWMLGGNFPQVGWPECGEIDIMEYRGQQPNLSLATVHGPGYSGGNGIGATYTLPGTRGFHQDFHVWAVEWSENRMAFQVDGHTFHEVVPSKAPGAWVFNQPFFVILNLAVGGHFVGAPNASTVFPQSLVIDYVRVYERRP